MRKLGMVVILTGIVVLVIGSNFSWSQSENKKPSDANYGQAWFDKIDADGDGKISREEHMKHAEKRAENRFTKMDVDKDGFISKDEFKKGKSKKRNKDKQKATEQQPKKEEKQ